MSKPAEVRPGQDPAATDGSQAAATAAAATASCLSTLGYGMFAWLQPGELTAIHSMCAVTELVRAEAGLDLDPGSRPGDAVAALPPPDQPVAGDTLFDEDLAAAQLLASLSSAGVKPASPSGAEEVAVDDAAPTSYSTHRETIAMLEEIAFLDE